MKFKDTVHDLDSSKDTWELLYCKIYREFFSSIFNFEELDDSETSAKCKRWYIKIDKIKQPELKNILNLKCQEIAISTLTIKR